MKHRQLLNLFAANAHRGKFRADASQNVIELYDVICSSEDEAAWFGGVSMPAFAKALRGMTGTVHLRINSPGGDVFAGIAMAQYMREYDGEIVAHIDGYAASIASIIAIAADKVIMAPGSMMMIHKAWTWGIGNADDLLATAELLEKIDGELADRYAARAAKADGKGAAAFLDMMAQTTWFTGQEAVDAGLADEMASEDPKKSEQAQARWDLSAYNRVPPTPALTEPTNDAAAEAAAAVAADAAAKEIEQHGRRTRALQLLGTAA